MFVLFSVCGLVCLVCLIRSGMSENLLFYYFFFKMKSMQAGSYVCNANSCPFIIFVFRCVFVFLFFYYLQELFLETMCSFEFLSCVIMFVRVLLYNYGFVLFWFMCLLFYYFTKCRKNEFN